MKEDGFEKRNWAVVLAGQSRDCERTDAALELYRQGKIDTLVLSGCRMFKTRYESEFALDYIVKQGYPREKVFEFRQDAYSTQDEAVLLIRQLRLLNLDTVLLITSNFHTARTLRIFNSLAGGMPYFQVHSAKYSAFEPESWWSGRESRKIWLQEWAKNLNSFLEIGMKEPVTDIATSNNLIPDIWSLREAGENMVQDSNPDDGFFSGMQAVGLLSQDSVFEGREGGLDSGLVSGMDSSADSLDSAAVQDTSIKDTSVRDNPKENLKEKPASAATKKGKDKPVKTSVKRNKSS